MSQIPHLGEISSTNARLFPEKLGASDLTRSMTFLQWNDRSCRLANGLIGLGLTKGDRVAILAYNCLEWLEIYVALAKAGQQHHHRADTGKYQHEGRGERRQ